MLFHSLLEEGQDVYTTQTAFTLEGRVDVEALELGFRRVLRRHSSLRTGFAWEGLSKPVQVVHAEVGFHVQVEDWRALDPAEREARFEAAFAEDRARRFDLGSPPLMRVALYRLEEHLYRLVWTFHHIVLDGWSVPLVLGEVFAACAEPHALAAEPKPSVPYAAFIDWLVTRDLEPAKTYWTR